MGSLAAEDIALFVEDYIAVRDVLMDVAEGDLSRPLRVAVAVHRESHRRCGSDVRICSVENSKLLSPLRLVVDCKMKCHMFVVCLEVQKFRSSEVIWFCRCGRGSSL